MNVLDVLLNSGMKLPDMDNPEKFRPDYHHEPELTVDPGFQPGP